VASAEAARALAWEAQRLAADEAQAAREAEEQEKTAVAEIAAAELAAAASTTTSMSEVQLLESQAQRAKLVYRATRREQNETQRKHRSYGVLA
jgi:hypothetical protein